MREDGFSLIEVVVALTVLAFVVLGFSAATTTLVRAADPSGGRLTAVELVQSRIREVAMDPDYDRLKSRYEGVETNIPGYPGYRRTTSITRVRDQEPNGQPVDYQRVVVTVEGPGLRSPLRRTITIAAP